MANPLIVDGRNLLDPAETRRAGFAYEGIGRPALAGAIRRRAVRRRSHGGDHPRRRQGRAARRRGRRPTEGARRRRRTPLAAYQVEPPRTRGRRPGHLRGRRRHGRALRGRAAGLGVEIVAVEEPERLGRGGGIKYAARDRRERGDVFALNGDELVDVDFAGLLARASRDRGRGDDRSRTAEVAVRPRRRRRRRRRARLRRGRPRARTGSTAASTSSREEALERFPDQGDHESTTFPELAAEGRLRAYRHEGLWLTVNTPKELRVAPEHVDAHPEWLAR